MIRIKTILTLGLLIFMSLNDSSNEIIESSANSKGMTYPVKIINISINRPVDTVYQFASDPENFPKWVAFVKSITKQGNIWIGKTDTGDLKIKFCPLNNLGVLDHDVTLPDGQTVSNPMRIVANGKGCEFIFTLFRLPNRTEEEFNEDAKAVKADLQTLKEIMEKV